MRSFSSCDSVTHEGKTNVWLTPRWVLDALGEFDLDPCAAKGWNTAKDHYYDSGLENEWHGRVWLNPPYGKNVGFWLNRLQRHANGIALVFARTDTAWFQRMEFDAINFIKGRIRFLREDMTTATNAGTPSCLIAFGKENVECLKNIPGIILTRPLRQLRRRVSEPPSKAKMNPVKLSDMIKIRFMRSR